MAFSWSSLPSAGDKIEWKASEQLDELRDNADWLADNAANTADNIADDTSDDGTIYGTNKSGDNPVNYSLAHSPDYITDNGGYDYGYDNNLHMTFLNDVDVGEDNPQYGTVNNSYVTSQDFSDNAKYSDVRLKKDIIYI